MSACAASVVTSECMMPRQSPAWTFIPKSRVWPLRNLWLLGVARPRGILLWHSFVEGADKMVASTFMPAWSSNSRAASSWCTATNGSAVRSSASNAGAVNASAPTSCALGARWSRGSARRAGGDGSAWHRSEKYPETYKSPVNRKTVPRCRSCSCCFFAHSLSRSRHPHSLNPHTWHFTHPSANSSPEPQSGHVPMNVCASVLSANSCACAPSLPR